MTEKEFKKGCTVFKERLEHQNKEVLNARKKLGSAGFSGSYFNRMIANRDFTKSEYKDFVRKYENSKNHTNTFATYTNRIWNYFSI